VGNFIFLGTHEPNDLARIQKIIRLYSKYADLIPALEREWGFFTLSFHPQPFFVKFRRLRKTSVSLLDERPLSLF